MKLEDASAYAENCISGDPASCTFACPFRLDIRSFLEKAERGKWQAAYKAFRNAVVFPVVVSALCPAPCKGHCQRESLGDEPIDMGLIEDACVRFAKSHKPDSYAIPPKTERIAIVGAGAAGLSCALNLAQKKFLVSVFEMGGELGGKLREHPRFLEFYNDIKTQFSAVSPELCFGREIKSLDELQEFEAVYIATGAGGNDFGLLSSWDESLLTTSNPKVFMGGALTGADTVQGIAQGIRVSKTIEVFLQTGKAAETYGSGTGKCTRYVDHTGAVSVPRVIPESGSSYTEEEAKEEAARCLKCDCVKCMTSCEMLNSFRKKPKKIATEVFTDTQVNPPYSSHTLTRQAYSCNMCGHCKSVCEDAVDIGALLRTSRAARVESGSYPEALHHYWLREMDFSTGEAFFAAPPEGKTDCEYAFFPGCQLGAHNPEHVLRSYEFLLEKYNAGIFINCCGAPAYWAGDDKRLEENTKRIEEVWHGLGSPVLVFACATCETLFKEFLPKIPRVPLYELLADSEDIQPASVYNDASVFDPCNARGNPEMEAAVRELARKSGAELHELSENNRCCGYGGHMKLANPKLYDKITENRAGAGENPYIVYCANCREVFVSRGKECAHILDIALNLPVNAERPGIEQKRKNALKVKKELMKKNLDAEFTPETREWDNIELIVSGELAAELDRKLISLSDIREAVWLAENTGDKFIDDSSGIYRCSMIKPVITYWVGYKKTDNGSYEIFEAYSHRMRFDREGM